MLHYLYIFLNLFNNRGFFNISIYSCLIKLLNTRNKIGLPEMYFNDMKWFINFIRITEHSNLASREKALQLVFCTRFSARHLHMKVQNY